MINHSLRARISSAVTEALRPLPSVLAGWEGGSAAFGAVDPYSDIDLEYLVADDAAFDVLYTSAERAIEAVSPITAILRDHPAPGASVGHREDGHGDCDVSPLRLG